MSAPRVAVRPYRLPLLRPFAFAGNLVHERRGLLVRLSAGGAYGLGEIAPLPGYGGEPLDRSRAALAVLAARLRGLVGRAGRLPATSGAWRDLAGELAEAAPEAPAARAGIELALADLAARQAGLPLARWWNPVARGRVAVNAAIGAVAPADAAGQAGALFGAGFRTLKLKLGGDPATDVERVAAVRAAVGAGAALRADANGAWGEAVALDVLRALAPYDLEYVEQPVAAAEVAALARLRRASPVPVAADEALLAPGGPDRVLAAGAADVLVLKPALLGGPSAAWALARAAGWRGMGTVVTTALDAAVGRAGALHLAAALPDTRWEAGLATGALLAKDVAEGPVAREGWMVPTGPGLGLSVEGGFEAP